MLKIDILGDENLSSVLDQYISGMLPHENFDESLYGTLLQTVFNLIKLEEMSMEYYAIFSLFDKINKMRVSVDNYSPTLNKEALEIILDNSVADLVRNKDIGIKQVLIMEGMQDNLNLEGAFSEAMTLLYSRTVELFDRCMEMKISSDQAATLTPALISAFKGNIAETTLRAQAEILNSSVRIGRDVFTGSDGWFEYISVVRNHVNMRTSEVDDNVMHLHSIEQGIALRGELKTAFEPLAEYGIPALDNGTAMLKHRFVVLAANEGVGKTTSMIEFIGKMLKAGRVTAVMTGESSRARIYAQILCNYIYQMEGLQITIEHLAGTRECTPEINRLINVWELRLAESGLLLMIDTLSYRNIYDELKSLYDQYNVDSIFIDHTGALEGKGDETENIDEMAKQVRAFKRRYPVFICVLSHLSSLAKEMVNKGKRITSAPTRNSSKLSQEADEVLVMMSNEMLKKQGLVAIDVYKRRGKPIVDLIILKMIPNVSSFVFDPKYQQGLGSATLSAEAAIRDIKSNYDEDGFDDDEYDEDDEDGDDGDYGSW